MCISRQSDDEPTDFRLLRAHVHATRPGYDVVSLHKKMGNPVAYLPHAVRQTYHIATSRAVVLDSYCVVVSMLGSRIAAPVVQLWHAMGNMKSFGYRAVGEGEGRSPELAETMRMHQGYDSVVISSLDFVEDFAAGFGVSPDIVYEAPLPRTDLFIDQASVLDAREKVLMRHPRLRGKKVIVYCPTFRKTPPPNQDQAVQALIDAIDFDRYALLYQAHPISTQAIDDERVVSGTFVDDFLFAADYVISDYSTIIYEAGLLDVPVYLYTYDWDSYSQRRSLNIDLRRDVPTLVTDDAAAIVDAIEGDRFDHEAYQAFIRRNITLPHGQSCTARVVDHVFSLIEA